jgi:hypothetical protein
MTKESGYVRANPHKPRAVERKEEDRLKNRDDTKPKILMAII